MPKKKKEQEKKLKENISEKTSPVQAEEDRFDFGGFPKEISLKKNLGCGS